MERAGPAGGGEHRLTPARLPACLPACPALVLCLQGAAKHVELRQDQHTLQNNDLNYIRQVWGRGGVQLL